MPTFIRLPPPEFPAEIFRRLPSPDREPSIFNRPSSRSSIISSASDLDDPIPAVPDSQPYLMPSFASREHTCENWKSTCEPSNSTEALLPATYPSETGEGDSSKLGTRIDGVQVDPTCAACRSYVSAKRAVLREDVLDAWIKAQPTREVEWDATSQESGVTVSSAGTGCWSIHDSEDRSQWFIPHHGPNIQWLDKSQFMDEWDDVPEGQDEGAGSGGDVAPAEAETEAESGDASGPSEVIPGESEPDGTDSDAKQPKKRLSLKVLSAMLPCIPVA